MTFLWDFLGGGKLTYFNFHAHPNQSSNEYCWSSFLAVDFSITAIQIVLVVKFPIRNHFEHTRAIHSIDNFVCIHIKHISVPFFGNVSRNNRQSLNWISIRTGSWASSNYLPCVEFNQSRVNKSASRRYPIEMIADLFFPSCKIKTINKVK